MVYKFTIHPNTLKEFAPKAKIAACMTLLGNRTLFGMEWKKYEDEKIKELNNKFDKQKNILLEIEKSLAPELDRLGFGIHRGYNKDFYYLICPLNDMTVHLEFDEERYKDFNELGSFFRAASWWSGPIGMQEIADLIEVTKGEAESIIKFLIDNGYIIREKFCIRSCFTVRHRFCSISSYWYLISDKKFIDRCSEYYQPCQIRSDLAIERIIDDIG